METSLRPKIRPTKRPKIRPTKKPKKRPSKEEMADIEVGRTIKRANRLDEMIAKESEGLLDKTPLVPIKKPTGEPVREFAPGGDVRHNPNRGKTY